LELRAKHAELLAENEDGSRFFQSHNPPMFPLPSVVENTEDHPDHTAANERRAELAEKAQPVAITILPESDLRPPASDPAPIPIPLNTEARRAQLLGLKHGQLLTIVKGLKGPALTIGTKAQLTAEILRAEGLEAASAGSDTPPALGEATE
jgi:hypothetical protein